MTNRTITFAKTVYAETYAPGMELNGTVFLNNQSGPTLSGAQLVSLYNLVASNLGRGSVRRFSDQKTGTKRVWAILCDWADQPEDDFEMSEEELAQQKGRGTPELSSEEKAKAIFDAIPDKFKLTPEPVIAEVGEGSKVVQDTSKPNSFKVKLSDADKAQIADEAKSRKPDPVEALMVVATTGAARTQLRNNPPASDNPAKDAEMPALRKAAKALNLEPKNKVYARKEGSKQAILVDLLSRPEGATFGELYDALAATGKPWKGVTIRSGLAWDINHIAGYGVKSELFNGEEFARQGRWYEANRLGVPGSDAQPSQAPVDGYDPELRLAVYRLTYPKGMDAPLPHVAASKKA